MLQSLLRLTHVLDKPNGNPVPVDDVEDQEEGREDDEGEAVPSGDGSAVLEVTLVHLSLEMDMLPFLLSRAAAHLEEGGGSQGAGGPP